MQIEPATDADVPELAAVLVDCVEGGASVGFLAGLDVAAAQVFWRGALPGASTWVARLEDDGPVVGVVQLHPAKLPNGAHRAEVAKLLVHRSARGRGVATALMARLEEEARAQGRWLLVLDTETGSAAQALYERSGWRLLGVLHDHAVKPDGRLSPTTILSKRLDGGRDDPSAADRRRVPSGPAPVFPSPTVPAASRSEVHLRYLDYFRAVLLGKLEGLPDVELRTSRLPSGWTPLELLKHLAHVEARWLEWGFEGRDIGDPWADRREGRWHVRAEESLGDLVGALEAQAGRSRAVVEAHALDEVGQPGRRWDGAPPATLERVLFHLLQEYARHVGHLDVVRELVDGRVGEE